MLVGTVPDLAEMVPTPCHDGAPVTQREPVAAPRVEIDHIVEPGNRCRRESVVEAPIPELSVRIRTPGVRYGGVRRRKGRHGRGNDNAE